MNEAMINLLTRRSVRKYKKEQISDSELQAVLGAGTYAPTARGAQSPLIVAVQNAQDIALMSRLNAAVWGKNQKHQTGFGGRTPGKYGPVCSGVLSEKPYDFAETGNKAY